MADVATQHRWTRWARWSAAGLLVGLGFVSARFKWVEVCHDEITAAGAAVEVCEAPALTDAVTVAWGAAVLGLVAPDLAEASVGGVFVLKRRVEAQKAEIDGLAAHVANLQTTVQQSVDASTSSSSQVTVNVVGGTPVAATDRAAPGAPVAPASDRGDEGHEDATEANALAARKLVELLRNDLPGALAGGRLHLYYPDDDAGMLMPVLEPAGSPSSGDGWRPGDGAVGQAWTLCEVVAVHGDEIVAGLSGLDPARRARYASTTAVIAAPLLNAYGVPVGVVSVSVDRPGAQFDDEAKFAIWEVAEVLARAVISLLGWATDVPTDELPARSGRLTP